MQTATISKCEEGVEGVVTTTYEYDHNGQRTSKTYGTSTTEYPFSHYEIKDGDVTKHIYLGDMLIATIEDDTPAPKVCYNHLDHLGSTNVVTSDDGYLNQVLSYMPFGDERTDQQYGPINQTNKFTGHDYDSSTELNYMSARYQDGETARFLSQDPASLNMIEALIHDPQLMNTYGYAKNNPVIYHDPNGELAVQATTRFGMYAVRAYNVYQSAKLAMKVVDAYRNPDEYTPEERRELAVEVALAGGLEILKVWSPNPAKDLIDQTEAASSLYSDSIDYIQEKQSDHFFIDVPEVSVGEISEVSQDSEVDEGNQEEQI